MDEKREEERVVTMIVSGESKTGPTHGRICNPWRLGESDARSREPIVEQSFMSSRVRDMTSAPIVVDDEDDDVVVSSPRAFAQVFWPFWLLLRIFSFHSFHSFHSFRVLR